MYQTYFHLYADVVLTYLLMEFSYDIYFHSFDTAYIYGFLAEVTVTE